MILITTEILILIFIFNLILFIFCEGLNCKHLWLVIVYQVSSVISNCPVLQFWFLTVLFCTEFVNVHSSINMVQNNFK